MIPNKLNLGCGTDIKKGWINLDITPLPGVNIVHNIETLPLPFDSEIFDEILCQDILEHVQYIPLLKELYRILKKEGTLTIRVPHFTSRNNFIDPTHKNRFSIQTFDFFSKASSNGGRSYYFDFSFSKILKRKITFDKRRYPYRYLTEFCLNIHPRFFSIYESTGLCYLFPAENIIIVMIK